MNKKLALANLLDLKALHDELYAEQNIEFVAIGHCGIHMQEEGLVYLFPGRTAKLLNNDDKFYMLEAQIEYAGCTFFAIGNQGSFLAAGIDPVSGKIKDERSDRCGKKCCVCGRGFTEDEWENRHEPHEEDCPGTDNGCECDLVAHSIHCPECDSDRAFLIISARERKNKDA